MADPPEPSVPEQVADVRFEATIHPGEARTLDLDLIADLDLDRVPDPGGLVRALVTSDDCTRLVTAGCEVRLHRAIPVRPLDPRLVAQDDQVREWFDRRIREISGTESG